MSYLISIDTISMELSIMYIKALPVKISIKLCIFSLEIVFILAYSVDPDEMLPCATFHLGLHCFRKELFTSIQNEKG